MAVVHSIDNAPSYPSLPLVRPIAPQAAITAARNVQLALQLLQQQQPGGRNCKFQAICLEFHCENCSASTSESSNIGGKRSRHSASAHHRTVVCSSTTTADNANACKRMPFYASETLHAGATSDSAFASTTVATSSAYKARDRQWYRHIATSEGLR